MKVVVIGGGLIGLSTAYFLRRLGHDVTLLERGAGVGQGAGFANGGLLTPSMPEPWNAPGCWRVLLASLVRSDSALKVRAREVLRLARWGVGFLRNSSRAAFEGNALRNLRLALHSLEALELLRQETGIEYGRAARGALRVFRSPAALDQAVLRARRQAAEGLTFNTLSARETVELEPALAPIADRLHGAIHYRNDEIGDAYRYSVALAGHLRQQGVEIHLDTEVRSLEARSGRVTSVSSERDRFTADRYIVCAGSYSAPLLRGIGVAVPVQPAKGYSLTFDLQPAQCPLRVPVVDDHLHAVVVPFERALRVAGTAEFAGYDYTIDPARIENLRSLVRQVLPEHRFDVESGRPWCGLRPMSVDGVPVMGFTPIPNLLVNTGHGHLGWTMAAGSGRLLADLVSGGTPSIDASPYALDRFTR